MSTKYIVQTWPSQKYSELFDIALAHGDYTHIDVAVAYATYSGVHVLEKILRSSKVDHWARLKKRWLVGIDWCRTDSPALVRLAALTKSEVKIPGGRALINRSGCTPTRPYHPKLFVLHGRNAAAVICGSGNLSANGLTKGCECGSVFLMNSPNPLRSQPELAKIQKWFNGAWLTADSFASIRLAYQERCDALAKQKKSVLTEDDVKPEETPAGRQGLSEIQLHQLRTYDNFWIEAGSLGANLGHGKPGNQLDMTRYTRVFFGAPAEELPLETPIDSITLVWENEIHTDRTLKFGNNGMDKLNVPPSGARGPLFYRGKTLLFTRLANGSFRFTVGDHADLRRWRRLSQPKRAAYALPGGRNWGIF
jgi:hypothetical protein